MTDKPHTPTPWTNDVRDEILKGWQGVPLRDASGHIVALALADPRGFFDHAETIRRAVNSHAELVAALKPFAEAADRLQAEGRTTEDASLKVGGTFIRYSALLKASELYDALKGG